MLGHEAAQVDVGVGLDAVADERVGRGERGLQLRQVVALGLKYQEGVYKGIEFTSPLPDLTVEGFPRVYVVGDMANTPDHDGNALPQLGSVAL